MVQELNNIEKDAAGKVVGTVKKGLEAAGRHLERVGKRGTEIVTGAGKGSAARMKPSTAKALGAVPYAAGAAGVGGGALALRGKGKEKGASALEKLAEQRAWELAKEAGYVDEEGNLLVPEQPEQEKEASALEQTVDTMALQMLEASGIPVEWNAE